MLLKVYQDSLYSFESDIEDSGVTILSESVNSERSYFRYNKDVYVGFLLTLTIKVFLSLRASQMWICESVRP